MYDRVTMIAKGFQDSKYRCSVQVTAKTDALVKTNGKLALFFRT